MYNIFEEVRNRVTMPEAISCYGFEQNRQNMICCPFHSEKTASMRIYETHFHCFGCGLHGDVIKFVQLLYNISPTEAVKKINNDFALGLSFGRSPQPIDSEPTDAEIITAYNQWEKYAYNLLNSYYKLLCEWYDTFRPADPDKPLNPLFVKACKERERVDYYCMVLISGSYEERLQLFKDKEYIAEIERTLKNDNK